MLHKVLVRWNRRHQRVRQGSASGSFSAAVTAFSVSCFAELGRWCREAGAKAQMKSWNFSEDALVVGGLSPRSRTAYKTTFSQLVSLGSDRSGNVAIVAALAMPVLIGATGLGVEASYWYVIQRSMQNAADSAAVAAATVGNDGYETEARSVAMVYGFDHGKNHVSVSASNAAPCPSGGTDCYSVTVTGHVPLFLSQMIGYKGNSTVSTTKDGETITSNRTQLSATAVARRVSTPRKYCVLAMGENGAKFDVLVNGGSKSDLKNCGIMSNDTMQCNGSGGIAAYADSRGGDPSPCGQEAHTRPVPKLKDPYASFTSNIPVSSCSGAPGEAWSASTSKTLPATYPVCGTLRLEGDVTITSSTAIVIYNGNLDLGDFKLKGASLTIVFAGANGIYGHTITQKNGSKGVLDITAPTSGLWKGVAIYQDPSLVSGVDIAEAGNSPTLNITGVVYLPHANVTVSGAINKSSSGNSCFVLVVDSLTVNGTGYLLSDGSECAAAGIEAPTLYRGRLVG
jgi:Flp pilus assembly protein TadG